MNKVLFILHFPPPVHGAAVVGEYIKCSNIINEKFKCSYINLGISEKIDEVGKGSLRKLFKYLKLIWKVYCSILVEKPDMVYMTPTAKGSGFFKDSLISILVKLMGCKKVYHFHNKGISTRQDRVIDNFFYKIVFKDAFVILLSELLYPDIQKYVQKEKVLYCPNGIPDNYGSSNRSDKNHKKVELLFLSNLIESKGILVLLDACRILKERNLDFHCTIVGGEADLTEQLLNERIASLGLKGNVVYQGKKYGLDKNLVFLNTDIFVFPTYYHNECFPLVLLEAIQFSLPIVSTFEGGIPEIVEDGVNGFLVGQGDIVDLVDKLELLILNPSLRKRMAVASRLRYESKFTLELFEQRFSSILLKILSSK